jgi:superfamily II DNA or RNA helicase
VGAYQSGRIRLEHLLSIERQKQLQSISSHLVSTTPLDPSLAADRVALYLFDLTRSAIGDKSPDERNDFALELIKRAVEFLATHDERYADMAVPDAVQVLAVGSELPTGGVDFPVAPLTPLLDSALHTNAKKEPTLIAQLLSEFDSADQVDVIMAFVLKTGVNFLIDAVSRAVARGSVVRVLTTTYLNSTDAGAVEMLIGAGAEVKISYDTTVSRLHAKSWIFHRRHSISTAYVGSSNLSRSAQVTGMEWNVRLSDARNEDVIRRMRDVFNSYWNHELFKRYDRTEFAAATDSALDLKGPLAGIVGITLKPFQEAMLDQIAASREWGQHRNLLVSATGTGKTVMAAVDYSRLKNAGINRLLFIAHRKEILDQSLTTFRQAVGDFSFGQKWYGGATPSDLTHVFASIQSLSKGAIQAFDPSQFDVIIIDEFHHAAAKSYQAVLEHFTPQEVLALTATPERSDGQDILSLFDGEIAAELRLWDAIDQQHLVPFHYFGVSDGTDLSKISYSPTLGYEAKELSNVYTGNHVWAGLVLKTLSDRVNLDTARALGFCVSVDHANFMDEFFAAKGIPSAVVTGETSTGERDSALGALRDGNIRIIFSVDVFNEGIDIPSVDTIVMMRPTESPVVFLQQLGRGLRHAPNKSLCTVLDFVGTHRKEFRYDRKFAPLLGANRTQMVSQIENGFPFLPAGCYMHLDQVAAQTVLDSIKHALPTTPKAMTTALANCAAEVGDPSLEVFLQHSGLSLTDVYANSRSWSDLRQAVGLPTLPDGPHEKVLRRAIGRLLHIDDPLRIDGYAAAAAGNTEVPLAVRRMLLAQLFSQVGEAQSLTTPEAQQLLLDHPQVANELGEMLPLLAGTAQHAHRPVPELPLMIHGRYTRTEIQAAYDIGEAVKVNLWQSGVLWVPGQTTDLFVFTIDKSSGSFSPTTLYNDYAMSPTVIHWESQSTTSDTSPTGLRYQQHAERGSSVMLFARQSTDERAFWFLGPATYMSHTGSRPMAIDWQLTYALPADLYQDLSIVAA